MNPLQETMELVATLNSMSSKVEKRKYLLNLRKSGYDFTPDINHLLFGSNQVLDKQSGLYILKTIANSKLLKLELAWCYINGIGCSKSMDNLSKGRKILRQLGYDVLNNHPSMLFESSFSGISWKESNLEEELRNELNQTNEDILQLTHEAELEIERIQEKYKTKKEERRIIIQTRQWRNKHRIFCFFIEQWLPVLYYIVITGLIDYLSFLIKENLNLSFIICVLIFEFSLLIAFILGKEHVRKNQKYKFPINILYLPFINCLILLPINFILFDSILILSSIVVVIVGKMRQNERIFNRDLQFFFKVLRFKLPPYKKWEYGYLEYRYSNLKKDFPHVPKRFSKYPIIYNTGYERFSQEGLYLNGIYIDDLSYEI